MSVSRIVEWLRNHGEKHNGGMAFTLNATDQPWMEFNAELQDWSHLNDGRELLFLGYYFEQNGDVCPDPELRFEIRKGEVKHIEYINWVSGSLDATADSYATEFAELVWKRHFENRQLQSAASCCENEGSRP